MHVLKRGARVYHGTSIDPGKIGQFVKTIGELEGPGWVTTSPKVAWEYSYTAGIPLARKRKFLPLRVVATYEVTRDTSLIESTHPLDLAAYLGIKRPTRLRLTKTNVWTSAFVGTVCGSSDGWYTKSGADIMLCIPADHLRLIDLSTSQPPDAT